MGPEDEVWSKLYIWQCLECLQGLTFVTAFKVSLVGNPKWMCYDWVCFHDGFRSLASHWHPKLTVLIGFSLGNFILNNSCKEQKIIVINSALKFYFCIVHIT